MPWLCCRGGAPAGCQFSSNRTRCGQDPPSAAVSNFESRAAPPVFKTVLNRRRPMEPTPDFNPKTATKKLLREGRSGALATLMPGSGDPYCSLVNVATAAEGAPLLLISRLAIHTKNILADARVSLMLDERKEGDPLQGARVMLNGIAVVTMDEDARRRYLERQPEAEMFA